MTAPPVTTVPEWLKIDPLAGIAHFLTGFGQGTRAAAEQANREQSSAQFSQELAQRQAKAQQDYELTAQHQKQIEAQNLAVALLHQQQLAETMRQHQEQVRHNQMQEGQAAENAKALNTSRGTTATETARHHDAMEKKRSVLHHVGNTLLRENDDGTVTPIFSAPGLEKLNPVQSQKLKALFHRKDEITKGMSLFMGESPMAQKKRADSQAELAKIDAEIGVFENRFTKPTESEGYLPKSGFGDLRTAETSAPTAPKAVRVREKKTGKTFDYPGDAGDIPKDEFDVLE